MLAITFEKLSRVDRQAEPCAVALPFAPGALTGLTGLVLHDGAERLPVQPVVTATWPDGSVKWLYLDFLADLPGNAGKRFELRVNDFEPVVPRRTVTVQTSRGGYRIDTGVLQAELSGPGQAGIISAVSGADFQFGQGAFTDPAITTPDGTVWTAVIDERGWQIVKPGPLVTTLQAQGRHVNASGAAMLDFEIQVSAFAGQPWLQVDYRIIHRETQPQIDLDGIGFGLLPSLAAGAGQAVRSGLATSNYRSEIRTGNGADLLRQTIDAEYLLYDQNEQIPETFYGTFWADWTRPDAGGACLTLFQAYQNFPKALEVGGPGILAGILPQGNRLTLYQGVAKTHRWFWHFHGPTVELAELNLRCLQFQMPDRATVAPEIYRAAGVLEQIFVDRKLDWVERFFVNLADSRIRAYGILAWGDAPDAGYTEQGRGNGKLVWTNNEYDLPHAAMLLYAKTAERRFLDYLLVTAGHLMDVDVCHYSPDPLRHQGQVMHSADHVSGKVSPCHEWVEGLLDFYHLTADQRVLATAVGIGENVIRLLATPRYQGAGGINARETGWALRSLVALYRETHDERWLEPAETIVGHFETWKKQYGGWLAPYTDHVAIRVPFMIAVAVNSLMRYYRVRPQQRIAEMVVAAVRDLVDNCRLENGLFYYKELPSLRRNGGNPLILEALAYAYEFTGDKTLLEAGLPTFRLAVQSDNHYGGKKRLAEGAVIQEGGASPKRFAQAFHAIAYYYRVAVEAGVLAP